MAIWLSPRHLSLAWSGVVLTMNGAVSARLKPAEKVGLSHLFRKWGTDLRVVSGSLICQESAGPCCFLSEYYKKLRAGPRFRSGGLRCCFA